MIPPQISNTRIALHSLCDDLTPLRALLDTAPVLLAKAAAEFDHTRPATIEQAADSLIVISERAHSAFMALYGEQSRLLHQLHALSQKSAERGELLRQQALTTTRS